jgi:small-conductance mechanosensitive channel
MKSTTVSRRAIAVLCAGLLGLASAGPGAAAADKTSTADIRQETAELLQALKNYGVEQRDEALARSRAALDNIDRRIAALEAQMLEQWDDMDQAARQQAHDSLQALRDQRTRVAEWYGSMKSSSAGAWGHIRQGFSTAYQALHEAWEKSEQEFASGEKQ